jgi:hypothetical protein
LKKSFFLRLVVFIIILLLTGNGKAFAAGTVLGIAPASGTFEKPFKAAIIIDGHGDIFNAAESTVVLSEGLKVKDISIGDCNFLFTHKPTTKDLSFRGIILKNSAKKCTVYTTTLIPNQKYPGSVSFIHATVRRYGDAKNVLTAVENGEFNSTQQPLWQAVLIFVGLLVCAFYFRSHLQQKFFKFK